MSDTIYVILDDKQKVGGARAYLKKDIELFKQENEKGFGIYFSVNEFDKERKAEKVVKLRYAYADIDIAKKGDGQSREEKQTKKTKLLKSLVDYCSPTFVIDTSNGLQPLWELQDKTVSEENKKRYVKILKGIREWSKNHGSAGDNVYDISRIVRLPGYYHHKEEPYFCDFIHKVKKTYSYEELEKFFPFEEKEYIPKQVNNTDLSLIDREIQAIDFQELITKAFSKVGRTASFDKQGRLILDGRLTGTFQGKKDDRQYLASNSHEPFKGNKITAVADIMGITNKEARQWIIQEYNLSYSKLVKQTQVKEQLKQIEKKPEVKKSDKRYTWGTRYLDTHFAIIKPSNFIVIGAKRSAGKTTYTFDMACKNALLGHKVVYISLEMDTEDILDDFGRKYSGITIEEEFDNKIPEHKTKAYDRKKKELSEIPNLIFEGIRRSENICWETIVAIIDKHENVGMVFIDNLDLIAGGEGEDNNERQKRIVKNIMAFTSSRQVPIVLIHHYRKQGTGKDYGMDELAGSGKISDGADRVVKISRNSDPLAIYPEKYESKIYLQKGRGYPEHNSKIYFIRGTFVDEAPSFEEYESGQSSVNVWEEFKNAI